MTAFRLLPLSAALAVALVSPARAQSLVDLFELARGYDATYQSAKSQYDANLAKAEQARAAILPSANLSASASRAQVENTNPSVDRSYSQQSATLSASQPLYRPANFASYAQGKKSVESAQAQLTLAGQDLILRVSQAYFDVLAAQDTLTFVQAHRKPLCPSNWPRPSATSRWAPPPSPTPARPRPASTW
jgi:outer membrane protein